MNLSTCSSFKARLLRPLTDPFANNAKYGHGAVQVGHRCVLVGGYSELSVYVYIYDLNKNSWERFLPLDDYLAYGRVKMIFTAADTLFAYVWQEGNRRKYELLAFDLVEMLGWRVVEAKDAPVLPWGASGCFVERRGEAMVISAKPGHSCNISIYHVEGKRWSQPKVTGKPPRLDMNHASCSTRLFVFVMGKIFPATHLYLFMLDVTRVPFAWSALIDSNYSPRSRYLFAASCTRNRIFVYGGYDGERSFDVYSIREKRWLTSFQMDNEWTNGTSENAVVQSEERLLVFGGFQLPSQTPLEITPI